MGHRRASGELPSACNPEVEEILNRFAEGIPGVMKFEPQYSMFHAIAFAATA